MALAPCEPVLSPTQVAVARDLDLLQTSDPNEMLAAEFFCVLLDGRTWTSGHASNRFARQLENALQQKMNLLLCHEEPGADSEARHAVPFSTFLVCELGATDRKSVV